MVFNHSAKLFLGLIGLVITALLIASSFSMDLNGEKEDCYDRYSNKIVGETCIVESSFDTREGAMFMMAITGIMITVILVMFGDMSDSISRRYNTI